MIIVPCVENVRELVRLADDPGAISLELHFLTVDFEGHARGLRAHEFDGVAARVGFRSRSIDVIRFFRLPIDDDLDIGARPIGNGILKRELGRRLFGRLGLLLILGLRILA